MTAISSSATSAACISPMPTGASSTQPGRTLTAWTATSGPLRSPRLSWPPPAEYNSVVFDSGQRCAAGHGDVFAIEPQPYDVVYLDPPYAPARDDNCYIKRYHFLEGLSVYWQGQEIMQHTRTRKLQKRYTPFSYKRTITDALRRTFSKFSGSVIVASYSSNAVPDAATIEALLREVKEDVEVRLIDHTYSFGTHSAALRRAASEYLFIGR